VARHVGGFSPFSCDITAALKEKGNTLTVRVHDATEGWQVRGKQALKPHGITYTRVTGIWQTVWLEEVPERYVADLDFETVVEGEKPEVRVQKPENGIPGAGDGVRVRGERAGKLEKEGTTGVSLRVNAKLAGKAVKGESLRVTVSFGGEEVAAAKGGEKVSIPIPQPRWWTPEHPNLYDLKVELLDGGGKVLDTVSSYSALRTVGKVRDARGHLRLAINGEEVFLLGPLDRFSTKAKARARACRCHAYRVQGETAERRFPARRDSWPAGPGPGFWKKPGRGLRFLRPCLKRRVAGDSFCAGSIES
jgi:beta-galactosidase